MAELALKAGQVWGRRINPGTWCFIYHVNEHSVIEGWKNISMTVEAARFHIRSMRLELISEPHLMRPYSPGTRFTGPGEMVVQGETWSERDGGAILTVAEKRHDEPTWKYHEWSWPTLQEYVIVHKYNLVRGKP